MIDHTTPLRVAGSGMFSGQPIRDTRIIMAGPEDYMPPYPGRLKGVLDLSHIELVNCEIDMRFCGYLNLYRVRLWNTPVRFFSVWDSDIKECLFMGGSWLDIVDADVTQPQQYGACNNLRIRDNTFEAGGEAPAGIRVGNRAEKIHITGNKFDRFAKAIEIAPSGKGFKQTLFIRDNSASVVGEWNTKWGVAE